GEARQHADIEYRALTTHPRDIDNAIINVLRFYEARNAIIFCNTRAAVARMTSRLTNRNFSVVALSGELTQSERSNALQSLRDGRARVCVATDVAARGIDLPNLELVIHADLPSNSDTLLHRSGRTGRAGRKGVSALIVPPKMRSKANRLLGWAKLTAAWDVPPSAAEVLAADEARMMSDPSWTDPVPEDAQEIVARLITEFSAEQLAAAFVNLSRARKSAPEELSDPTARDDRPRKAFGPSVWFSVSLGRRDGAEPRVLLPMVCKRGELTKDDIGAIRIQQDHSYVEVLASRADAFVAAVGADMVLEEGARLTRLDSPPNLERAAPSRSPRPSSQKPARDSTSPERRPRKDDKPHKPAAAPKGKKPPKAHKTDRSPMKPGATPKPKSDAPADRPRAKPVWTKENRAAAKSDRPKRDTRDGKPKGKPAGKRDTSAAKKRAADTSKRFVPPHKRGKPGGRGPNATPRRKT
ncbi:MAG: helicase-related protein, partial [Pseudomonadota bacterium]